MNYFGTDGIRVIADDDLNILAYKCGYALSGAGNIVVVGRDNRPSGEQLLSYFCKGVTTAGGKVLNLGITSTPCVAYMTKQAICDWGVMLTASHNPEQYNGIKIFDNLGYKIAGNMERSIQQKMCAVNYKKCISINSVNMCDEEYINYCLSVSRTSLQSISVVVDTANGSTSQLAHRAFERLLMNADYYNDSLDGKINENCGCLFVENIVDKVLKKKAQLGVAFDGDGDRIIAVDNNGQVLDGDCILYCIAVYLKQHNRLPNNLVIGTHHTNMGIQNALADKGISLLRTDVGDKYVVEKMLATFAWLGGEQSGHIICLPSTTGDGLYTALTLCKMIDNCSMPISSMCDYILYPQCNIALDVINKDEIMHNSWLNSEIDSIRQQYQGRILVRASGTEPKIRIMAEGSDYQQTREIADLLATKVNMVVNGGS
ncbi:MAG: phosphoglucosamine mutase [Clostridia bacterium]|nr:phosphoglucosamine mutase [Clostridia bacterium]MDD3832104.1 phosphoglucosamine mutase [Clostridia bacterium]